MIQRVLEIRFIQMIRATKGIGMHRLLFILFAFIAALVFTFIATKSSVNSLYTICLYLLIIVVIHIKRSDGNFISVHINNRYLLYLSEYLLLVSPLLLSLLIHHFYLYCFLFTSLVMLVPLIRISISTKTINTIFQKLIPSNHFEWKGGVRSSIFFIIPLYLIGISFSFYTATIPIVIIILSIIICSFYTKIEPLTMIIVFQKSAKSFLLYKTRSELILYNMVLMPLYILFIFFHFEYSLLLLALVIILNLTVLFHILIKYIVLPLNEMQTVSSSLQTFGFLGIVFPLPFVFVNLVLTIKFFYQASSQLKPFLNDYH